MRGRGLREKIVRHLAERDDARVVLLTLRVREWGSCTLKLEHVALNVADPVAMAGWYREHLGMEIAMRVDGPPHTHFLRDSGGTMMLEIYKNPPDQVPDYRAMDPLLLHVAFVCADPAATSQKLQAAGAVFVNDVRLADGSYLVMLRDPWGLAIQLCKRGVSLLK